MLRIIGGKSHKHISYYFLFFHFLLNLPCGHTLSQGFSLARWREVLWQPRKNGFRVICDGHTLRSQVIALSIVWHWCFQRTGLLKDFCMSHQKPRPFGFLHLLEACASVPRKKHTWSENGICWLGGVCDYCEPGDNQLSWFAQDSPAFSTESPGKLGQLGDLFPNKCPPLGDYQVRQLEGRDSDSGRGVCLKCENSWDPENRSPGLSSSLSLVSSDILGC